MVKSSAASEILLFFNLIAKLLKIPKSELCFSHSHLRLPVVSSHARERNVGSGGRGTGRTDGCALGPPEPPAHPWGLMGGSPRFPRAGAAEAAGQTGWEKGIRDDSGEAAGGRRGREGKEEQEGEEYEEEEWKAHGGVPLRSR